MGHDWRRTWILRYNTARNLVRSGGCSNALIRQGCEKSLIRKTFINMRLCLLVAVLSLIGMHSAIAQPQRARTLIFDNKQDEWTEQPDPQLGTPEGDLHTIRKQIVDGEFETALKSTDAFNKRFGKSDPMFPHLLIARAEAMIGLRMYDEAYEELQSFLAKFAGMSITSQALRLKFVIAEAHLAGAKRKILGMKLFSGVDRALEILDEISSGYPDRRIAELAIKTKADYLFATGDHVLAEFEYERLLREYPRSRYQQIALRRSAESALAEFAGIDYDEAPLVNAAERYREYRIAYRGEAQREGVDLILEGIKESRAEKERAIGAYYERTGHAGAAIYYYEHVAKNWPDTIAATKTASRLLELKSASPEQQNENEPGKIND